MKQCQRPMVNQPCPIFKVSQQIAGTICPINIYKKHQVYKYYSRELCPKDLCLLLWVVLFGVTDIFYPQIPSIALFELCHQIHPFRKSTENSQVSLPIKTEGTGHPSCEVTLFAINSLKRLNEPFPEPRIFKMYSPPHSVSIKVGNELPEYCFMNRLVSLFCT